MAKSLSSPSFKLNIYPALIYRLLIVFVLLALCRLFFFLYNHEYYTDIDFPRLALIFWGGFRFDLTALLYLNALYLFMQIIPFKIRHNRIYQQTARWIFVFTNAVGIIINMADTVYYQITLKRTTAAIFQQFAHEVNLPGLVFRFLVEYWYVDVLAVFFIIILIFLYNKVEVKPAPNQNIWKYTVFQFALMAVTVYLTIVGIRGGFKHSTRPITLSNASAYITKPNERAIVLNTPFAIFRTLKKNSLQEKQYFSSQEEQEKVFTAYHSGKPDSIMAKKNVVVFILESFGTEHIGALNRDIEGYKGYTPFLDSLIGHSYTFRNSYANGRKSISGMPSVLASIPSLVAPFVLSHYSGNKINSLASTLGSEDYYTAFFHGAANGSMGFDAFTNQAGFDDYFGKDEFDNNDAYDGIWGIWDEEFFQYFNTEMGKMKQPFFTALFSVSSHHPFILPDKYKNKFPKGSLKIHKNVGYTDYSLRRFFDEAKKSDWYNNTIFVLTADHASTYSDILKYKTSLGTFTVPIIIFNPENEQLTGFDQTTIVQQNDIMPTVLGMLNYPKPYVAFGNDMFDQQAEHFTINYVGDSYQLIMDGYMLQHNGESATNLFDIEKDELLTQNLLGTLPDVEAKMDRKLKAIIQEYNRRLIRNEMVITQ
ncbi:sulfatase-like hydrolase/transferase [Reichenbachiella sp. MALMAid0571]|uniref:LTA synthase family protein n=1 Tax=Reichenbachiella sp. MALMAid0571 TaxID=3143939 RepID=UPI0032DF4CE3